MSALREQPEGRLVILNPQRRARLSGRRAPAPTVRVVIADGQALVRAGFRVLLEDTERVGRWPWDDLPEGL